MTEPRRMVFHNPLPIFEEASAGSQVHPLQMLRAFQQLGYEVEVAAGYADERKRTIERLKREVEKGHQFDFVYSESSTMPTLLTERHHLPTHPFLDFGFLGWMRRRGTPVGLFLCDIHWRFEFYKYTTTWPKRIVAIAFYRYDWIRYRQTVDHLFLPSHAMKGFLPVNWPENKFSALPPGTTLENTGARATDRRIRLFYVGGVQPPIYDLKPLFDGVRASDNVFLTLCCRKAEWEKMRVYYEPVPDTKVRIIHAHGHALAEHYVDSDLIAILWKPYIYLSFAAPVKLYEALGYGVPIVTTAGTETARVVQEEGIGWVVSTTEELVRLFDHLRANPHEIAAKRQQALIVREKHTWVERAHMVADILTRRKAPK